MASPTAPDRSVRVLLIDDDRDDYLLTRDLFAEIPGGPGTLGGTMRLFPTETGCTLRTSSRAEVSAST